MHRETRIDVPRRGADALTRGLVVTATGISMILIAASPGSAASQLTRPQYIARADAICAAAGAQVIRLAPLAPMNRTAKIGDRWLAIDRHALAALHTLTPPASDRATVAKTLKLADKTVNTGLVALVKAAKSGSAAAYATAGAHFGILLRASHAAAAHYGSSACARW